MADGTPPARQMSLIPYSNNSREIVLRRGNAVVIYDNDSRQLSVRDATDQLLELSVCPTCRRPLYDETLPTDPEDHTRAFSSDGQYVDPEYFAMLAASRRPSPLGSGHATPTRPIFQPALRSGQSRQVSSSTGPPTGAEFVASEPSLSSGQGISSSAFSPGYFKQFFREERELGRGGNGVVLLVEHIMDGVSLGRFACKRIPVGNSHSWLEKVLVEVKLLQRIPHENIVKCHWTWLEDFQPSQFGPSIPCIWILQEYCNGGDLQSYVIGSREIPTTAQQLKDRLRRRSRGDASPPAALREGSKLSLEEIFSFFRDITSGLHHLHSKGYIHRDLKPSNCLLQRDGGKTRILVSDFGEVQEAGAVRGSTGATGTISYCAPEVLERGLDGSFGDFSTKSDVFSLGMIVYFMCFGRLPYLNADGISEENEDLDQLRAEITSWPGFDDETRARVDLPEKLYKFLKRLLSVDRNERPSTDEILSSVKGGISIGDLDDTSEDRSPRISSTEPQAATSSTRHRKLSALVPRPSMVSPVRRKSGEIIRPKSPIKRDVPRSRPTSPADGSMTLRPRNVDLPPATQVVSPQQSPRLLLPPPPPKRSIFQRTVKASKHPKAIVALRAGAFLIKILSMSVPCSPYSANQWLFYPLLALAALELSVFQVDIRQSLVSFSLHMACTIVAHQHGRLCEGGHAITWDDFR